MDFIPQKTKGYEVDGVIPTFVLFRLCIGYINRHAVVSVIPVFVILRLCIGYTNRYAVGSATFLTCTWVIMIRFLFLTHANT